MPIIADNPDSAYVQKIEDIQIATRFSAFDSLFFVEDATDINGVTISYKSRKDIRFGVNATVNPDISIVSIGRFGDKKADTLTIYYSDQLDSIKIEETESWNLFLGCTHTKNRYFIDLDKGVQRLVYSRELDFNPEGAYIWPELRETKTSFRLNGELGYKIGILAHPILRRTKRIIADNHLEKIAKLTKERAQGKRRK